jgi:hypothetical protein
MFNYRLVFTSGAIYDENKEFSTYDSVFDYVQALLVEWSQNPNTIDPLLCEIYDQDDNIIDSITF